MDSLFVIELTRKCNMECSYCYLKNKESINFSIDHIESSIGLLEDKIKQSDIIRIEFLGGEPLLNLEGLKYAITRLNAIRSDINYSMVSNGTIYSKEIVDILNQNNFDFYISLDGIRFVHNANRVFKHSKKGSFNVIEKNVISFIQNLNKDLCISMTLNDYSIPYFYQSIKHMSSIGVKGINLGIVRQMITETNFDILKKEVVKLLQDQELYASIHIPELQKPDMNLYVEQEVDLTKGTEFKIVKTLDQLNEAEKKQAKKHFFFLDVITAAKEMLHGTKRK